MTPQTAEKVPQGSPRKASLLASLRKLLAERPAVGERSLLVWARQQRPPLTSVAAERLANTLVARREVSVETRPDGSQIWRGSKRPPPSAAKLKEEPAPEPSPTPPLASAVRATPTPEEPEEEPVLLAGTPAEPCSECERLKREDGDLRRQLADRIEERDALLRERDDLRRRMEAPPAETPVALSPPDGPETQAALGILDRLPAEQRRLVGAVLTALGRAAAGGDHGLARVALSYDPSRGPRLSRNCALVLAALPKKGAPLLTPREIADRARIIKNSAFTALRTLERYGMAINPAYGRWGRA